jgi:transcription antitermination factor NusG
MNRDDNNILDPNEAGRSLRTALSGEQWYALYVQVNHEKEIVKRLEQKEVYCFLPVMETWSKRLDRRKKIQLPLFPGYVFVHVILDNYMNLSIVKTPGALNLLRNSDGPLSIPSYQIENLQTMVKSTQPLELHPYLKEGDWVHVVRGPLFGCIGILKRLDPKRGRLILSVDIIRQSVSVELDLEDVEPSSPPGFK